jgi:hypothetical protein
VTLDQDTINVQLIIIIIYIVYTQHVLETNHFSSEVLRPLKEMANERKYQFTEWKSTRQKPFIVILQFYMIGPLIHFIFPTPDIALRANRQFV